VFGKRTLICGDPLCAPQATPALLRALLAAHPHTGFFQVSEATTEPLRALGYVATQLGIETVVELADWSLRGRKRQNLRSAYNLARRDGLELVEGSCAEMGAERMMRISRDWMRGKTIRRHEIAFFARPIVFEDEPGVRKFFALRDGVPVGYVYLDPMYDDGRLFGYAANILRHDATAPSGLCDALLVQAALTLKAEGCRELHLGMSPFFRPPRQGAAPAARSAWYKTAAADAIVDANWRLLNGLFHYRGIAFHKRRWRASERPVYYAGRPLDAVFDFYAAARMTGVL
jgi:lysylphosphatidylglycerol synthetase-like protein (DUF2156 family)